MDRYALDGVVTWWLTPEDAPVDSSVSLATNVNPTTLKRVPDLVAAVLSGMQQRQGGAMAAAGDDEFTSSSSAAGVSAAPAARAADAGDSDAAAGELAAVIGGLRRGGFKTTYEAGLEALQTLTPVEQMTVLSSYGELSSDLMRFLRTFAEAGRVVTKQTSMLSLSNSLHRADVVRSRLTGSLRMRHEASSTVRLRLELPRHAF